MGATSLPTLPGGSCCSALVFGAPPGGAATDRGDPHGRTVAGAGPAGSAGLHHVAQVRSATLREFGEGLVNCGVQPAHPHRADSRRRDAGRHPGPPQDFVGQEVADPAHRMLVEDPGLYRRRRGRQDPTKRREGQSGCVDPESAHVGIELHRAEASGIADGHRSTPLEADAESIPGGVVPAARVQEFVDTAPTVDQQTTGHAKAQPENHLRQTTATEIDEQQLAVTPSGEDGGPDDRRNDVRRAPTDRVVA